VAPRSRIHEQRRLGRVFDSSGYFDSVVDYTVYLIGPDTFTNVLEALQYSMEAQGLHHTSTMGSSTTGSEQEVGEDLWDRDGQPIREPARERHTHLICLSGGFDHLVNHPYEVTYSFILGLVLLIMIGSFPWMSGLFASAFVVAILWLVPWTLLSEIAIGLREIAVIAGESPVSSGTDGE
jgi:hypothetical protein